MLVFILHQKHQMSLPSAFTTLFISLYSPPEHQILYDELSSNLFVQNNKHQLVWKEGHIRNWYMV